MWFSCDAIANPIQYGVATSVTPTYNTTNTSNELPFYLFTLMSSDYPLFCIEMIQMLNFFQSQELFLHIFLPYFIIKIYYEKHIIHCLNIALSLSIQFHHAINFPVSHPLKLSCHGCWQISREKIVAQEKSCFNSAVCWPIVMI